MKVIHLLLISFILISCKSPEQAKIVEKEEDSARAKRIETNKPRTLSIQFTDNPELVTYGFVMQASWDDDSQSTTMFITGDFERKELSSEDKDEVYEHLKGFYELPNISDFIDNTDSEIRQKNGKYNLLTFDLHEFEYKMYSLPKEHQAYKDWIFKFHELYENLIKV